MANDEWTEVGIAPAWNYKENKVISGVFVKTKDGVGPNNSKLHYLETPDGETIGVLGNAILDARFETLKPGEEVRVEYLGDKPSKKTKGRTYHDFKVSKRGEPLPGYDMIEGNE